MPKPLRILAHPPVLLAALLALVLAATCLSLVVGARAIPPGQVVAALTGAAQGADATVITSQRLPRTLLAIAVGLALGAAGAVMQGHTRNPLADPGLFGIEAGAALGVALVTFTFDLQAPAALVGAALAGAALASAVLFVVGLRSLRGGAVVMLAVLGTTLAALLSALVSALVLLDRQTLDELRFWQVGSLALRDLSLAWLVGPLLGVGLVLALANGNALRSLGLGDDVAHSLGTGVLRARTAGIAAVALLTGGATALCGPIGFVGLVAPHAVRLVVRHDYRVLVPAAGLAGAAVLLTADTIGRVAAPPGELQAGIVMAVIGAPVLLAVARRRRVVAL